MKAYFKELNACQIISAEEERELLRNRHIPSNREKLIKSNLKFVVTIAKRFMGKGLPLEDLINEGNMGLMKAIEDYDLSKNYKLITYAKMWIIAYIQKAIYNTVPKIRVPFNKLAEMNKIKKGMKAGLTFDEAFSESGIRTNHKLELYNLIYNFPLSIDFKNENDKETDIFSFIITDERIKFVESVENQDLVILIDQALKNFTDKEIYVIEHKFGLNGCIATSFDKIAESIRVSKQRAKQIEKNVMKRIKLLLSNTCGDFLNGK